jgi:hypothetical protein
MPVQPGGSLGKGGLLSAVQTKAAAFCLLSDVNLKLQLHCLRQPPDGGAVVLQYPPGFRGRCPLLPVPELAAAGLY